MTLESWSQREQHEVQRADGGDLEAPCCGLGVLVLIAVSRCTAVQSQKGGEVTESERETVKHRSIDPVKQVNVVTFIGG